MVLRENFIAIPKAKEREKASPEEIENYETRLLKAKEYFETYREYHRLWRDIRPFLKALSGGDEIKNIKSVKLPKERLSSGNDGKVVRKIEKSERSSQKSYRRLTMNRLSVSDPQSCVEFINKKKIREQLFLSTKDLDSLNKEEVESYVNQEIELIVGKLAEIKALYLKLSGNEDGENYFTDEDVATFEFKKDRIFRMGVKVKRTKKRLESLLALRERASLRGDYKTMDKAKNDYKILKTKLDVLLRDDVDAHYAVAIENIMDMRTVFSEGKGRRVVETPYVLEKMSEIMDSLEEGRPVFLYGEKGAGKTEVARHLSITQLNKKFLLRWKKDNPPPVKPEAPEVLPNPDRDDYDDQESFDQALLNYEKAVKEFEQYRSQPTSKKTAELKEWRKKYRQWLAKYEELKNEVFVISGNKNTDTTDLLGGIKMEKVIKRTPEEQTKIISDKIEAFRLSKKEESVAEDRVEELVAVYVDALKDFFKNPIEAKGYLGLVYRAMMEGRPVIIDEINAIPHNVLIVLNEILTRRPGDLVKPLVDDLPPFEVKDGFVFICTGNWRPATDKVYIGRQAMDSAFLSRFDKIKYDYLPNAIDSEGLINISETDPNFEQQMEKRRKLLANNELFHMMVVRLMDDDGNLTLPEDKKMGEEALYRLAVVARGLQDIFSGNKIETNYYLKDSSGANIDPRDVLKENVLTFRELATILSEWKKDGFSSPLDVYLYRYYVSQSDARPEEKAYIYKILSIVGNFFQEKDEIDWPEATDFNEMKELVNFSGHKKFLYGVDAITRVKKNDSQFVKRKNYDLLEVADLLFGKPAGQARKIPEKVTNEVEVMPDPNKMTPEERVQLFLKLESEKKQLEELLRRVTFFEDNDVDGFKNEGFLVTLKERLDKTVEMMDKLKNS